jgi:hypothetical protein
MEIRDPPDIRRFDIIPVVRYAFERRIAFGKPDYWDYATRLELAVLLKDEKTAADALSDALASVRARWELETTVRNLRLIREARQARGEIIQWASQLEEAILKTANDMQHD